MTENDVNGIFLTVYNGINQVIGVLEALKAELHAECVRVLEREEQEEGKAE